jgi:hypothetical protein
MSRFRELLPQFAHVPARVVYPRTRFDPSVSVASHEPSARPARPAFVVIVSAEPGKNLKTVIRAFRKTPQADLGMMLARRRLIREPSMARVVADFAADDRAKQLP